MPELSPPLWQPTNSYHPLLAHPHLLQHQIHKESLLHLSIPRLPPEHSTPREAKLFFVVQMSLATPQTKTVHIPENDSTRAAQHHRYAPYQQTPPPYLWLSVTQT